jgi:hypothetical protein
MQFQEFLLERGIAASPVERFDGFVVEVGAAAGWNPFDSAVGLRVWVNRNDPLIKDFCANAVLTMHSVDAVLDVREVFTMLAEQQAHMVPGCHESHRELAAATEGAGAVGTLLLDLSQICGLVISESQSRIIATDHETLIAQLTVTALRNSPVNRSDVWLTVTKGAHA